MGFMYANGHGAPQNYPEAMRWYKLAAAQDHPTALSNLGFMFDQGLGVEADDAQALRWYTMAAKKGDPNAVKNRDLVQARIEAHQAQHPG
jgi:TPR repeat protein